MALSPAAVALLRGSRHTVTPTLNAAPKAQVASAQINQSAFTYPIAEVTVDNTSAGWANIRVGQAFSIGTSPGAADVTAGVVRKLPAGNTFYLDAKSLGDPGYPRNLIRGLEDDLYLTVWKHRPPWGLLSAIRNKTFYKQWDVTYSDQGSQPSPIARIGQHRQADADPATGKAQLTFTADPYPWGAATIAGHQWALDGGTVIGGSLTAAGVTAEFEAGWYVIEYTCTDSNGKTHTGFRYLWVNDSGDNAPFGTRYLYDISNDTEERQGRKLTVTFYGTFADTDLYPGQAFLLTETARFDGEAVDGVTDSFFGYLASMDVERGQNVPSITVEIESPLLYAKRLPCAPQQMTEKVTPVNWTQVKNILSNPVGAVWYILQHHAPQLLAAHDFEFDLSLLSLRKQSFVWQQDNIGAMLESLIPLAQFANLGSLSDGTLVFTPSAVHLSTQAERDALDTRFTWDVMDILAPLRHERLGRLPAAEVQGGAFAYSGGAQATPFRSRAPGNAQAQGVGRSEFTTIVTVTQGQARLNELTGHQFAVQAAETPSFEVDLNRNLDIIQPQRTNVWHGFAFPIAYDPFSQQWVNRALPLRVSRSWRHVVKHLSVTWQPDTFGQPGVTVPVNRSAAAAQPQYTVRYDPNPQRSFALAWNTDGIGARTFSFNSSLPHWETLSPLVQGKVNDMALDYSSPLFVDGAGALGAWVVTTSGATLRIYYVPDTRAPVTQPTLQATYTMDDATVDGTARIASSKTEGGFVVAAWRGQSGTRLVRTTDGETWGSAITVGDTTPDTDHDNAEIGLAVDGTNQLVTARHADGSYYLYLATTTGGGFSWITTSPASDAPYPLIVVDGAGSCFVRTTDDHFAPRALNITFDPGGTEANTGAPYGVSAGIVTGGNPGNCFRARWTVYVADAYIFVDGLFTDPLSADTVTCTSVSFDYKLSTDWALGGNFTGMAYIEYHSHSGLIKTVSSPISASQEVWHTFTHVESIAGCHYLRVRFNVNLPDPIIANARMSHIDNIIASIL